MIENITHDGLLMALIIRSEFRQPGITFFTPQDFSQQLGYMNRPKGYTIAPHIHRHLERKVFFTQEVLLVRSGRVRVDFYNEAQQFLESRIIVTGDVILLAAAGHGFEFLEASELIEVKQGPYNFEDDKVRFIGTRHPATAKTND
jgi:mannose-6-phosphate isomerase-like protein (cupin superfamily)